MPFTRDLRHAEKRICSFLQDFIHQQAHRYVRAAGYPDINNDDDMEDFLCNHLFGVHVTFNDWVRTKPQVCRNAFRSLYIEVCKKTIGNNWSKKVPAQPFVIAAIDDEGRRPSRRCLASSARQPDEFAFPRCGAAI